MGAYQNGVKMSQPVMGGQPHNAYVSGHLVWDTREEPVIVAAGTIGTNGASWTLFDNRRVVVNPGRIDWNHGTVSPWNEHEDIVTEIEFSGMGYNIVRTRSLFAALTNLNTILGMEQWDMGNVSVITNMFRDTHSLISLNLSNWDVSNAEMFGTMFAFSGIQSLDISGWGTSSATTMSNMFRDARSLRRLILGEHFVFLDNALLPAVPNNTEFAGLWQNVGAGTEDSPQGAHIFTSAQLMANYDGTAMADTWVWRRH